LSLKGSLIIKILVLSLLITALIAVLTFTGCSKVVTPEQEIVVEEVETEEEVAEEEEEEENQAAPEEITGNINILTGFEISETVKGGRPIAVMIENTPASRPPTALSLADVLFEIVDEYDITRFIALYSSTIPELVGPTRSTRPYYAEAASSFDPLFVFWGSWCEGYKTIMNLNMDYFNTNDEKQINCDSGILANLPDGDNYYTMRDSTRVAPHNAYVYLQKIQELAEEYDYSLDGGMSPFRFKQDAEDNERGDYSDITIKTSELYEYIVDFEYSNEENIYYKNVGGSPHVDRESGQQLTFNNIVVMVTDIEGPIDEAKHMVIRTFGKSEIGKAFFFMDGKLIKGTWERISQFDPYTYEDKNGNPIFFNRGSTYIAIIKSEDNIIY
jgi:hypothetical protein